MRILQHSEWACRCDWNWISENGLLNPIATSILDIAIKILKIKRTIYLTSFWISLTNCCTDFNEPKSTFMNRHFFPAAGFSLAIRMIASSVAIWLRQAIITSQPWSASDLAVSNPIPTLQPVMTAVFPDRSFPCKICRAVLLESNRCRTSLTFLGISSTAKASLGSVYVLCTFFLSINTVRPLGSFF